MELTSEAKLAIQQYILRLILIPGLLLGIISFVTGFFVNEVARGQAYSKAYRESIEENSDNYIKSMEKFTKLHATLAGDTAKLMESNRIQAGELKKLIKEIEETKNELNTAKAFQDSLEKVNKVAEILRDDPNFHKKILDVEPWRRPELLNGWVPYDSTYNKPGYFKDKNGIVHLKGLIKDGEGDFFILPSGYTPSMRELHAVQTYPNTIGRVDITTDGTVTGLSLDPKWISLDGISFRAGTD